MKLYFIVRIKNMCTKESELIFKLFWLICIIDWLNYIMYVNNSGRLMDISGKLF